MVIGRTVVLVLCSGANTLLQTWLAVDGVELKGAVGYAGVWAVAAGISGAALGIVGAV